MLVVAAFVTPGPDVMSQVILFAAIYPLYEISILLVRFFERRREAELRAQGLWDRGRRRGVVTRRRAALARIAAALERLSPPPQPAPDLAAADAFVWQRRARPARRRCRGCRGCRSGSWSGSTARATRCWPTPGSSRGGFPPTTCCSGARAAWASRASSRPRTPRPPREAPGLKLIELHREDLPTIGRLLGVLRGAAFRFILFCDDLSLRQGRQPLQVVEGGSRRRDRGPAGERGALRHLEPPAPDAARDDRERAADRR